MARPPTPVPALEPFGVHPDRGFLPFPDPLPRLPPSFAAWEELAQNMPRLLAARRLRAYLDDLPVLDTSVLPDDAQHQRAMLLLSYFGHGYVWGDATPADHIPAGVAVPWHQVAKRLGRPPVLSYASYSLHNWRRLDPAGPIALGNIVLLQSFLGGLDEEWFVLVHVEIEAEAAPAIKAVANAQTAVASGDLAQLEQEITTVAAALEEMNSTLLRMTEHCDPYIYYNRVRPYLHGWKDNPGLPNGVVYDGVEDYGARPQQSRGSTAAQSSIIPTLDAALGIGHKDDPLRPYLMEMRQYMPPGHRAFIEAIEVGPSVRACVLDNHRRHPVLRTAYNDCVSGITRFRAKHLEYAALYILRQSQRSQYNPTAVGTGGTPFMPYLKKHRDETEEHLVP
ncbi:MAG: hypothetical protein HY683_07265 [Chloroflexi bacterium]|nr:hypothetical protein [Chloroflexota bacterium]